MHTTLASIEENVSKLDSEVEDLKTKSKQLGSTVNEVNLMRRTYPTQNLKTKRYNRMFASSRNNFFTWRLTQGGKM